MFICCFVCFLFFYWKLSGFTNYSQWLFQNVLICLTGNTTRGQDIQVPGQPFDHLQMDFISFSENGTIKNKLVKCCDDTGLSWIKALPVVLMAMRGRGRARTGLSPFEILPGRPMNTRMEKTKENQVLNSELLEDVMLSYCVHLTKMLSLIHTGKSSTPATSRGPVA